MSADDVRGQREAERAQKSAEDVASDTADAMARLTAHLMRGTMPSGVTPQDQYPTAGLSADDKGSVDNFRALVKRVEEDRRIRENGIFVLVGRLAELAAEGDSMSAEEVRRHHGAVRG